MYTAAGVAAIALTVAALVLINLKSFKRKVGSLKFASLLMVIGGFGIGGLIGRYMRVGSVQLTHQISGVSSQLIGVGVPLLIAIYLIGQFVIHMAKGHKPNKFTPWLGLVQFPIAAPLLPGAAGDNVSAFGQHVFEGVQTFLIQLFT